MIRLDVFDFNFERQGNIEKYTYISYNRKYQDVGSFHLKCPASSMNNSLIQKQRFIWIEDDVCGIVQYISKERDDSDVTLDVQGNLISGILDWRWVYPCFVSTGKANLIMEEMVNVHCINPADGRRKFANLVIGTKGELALPESITYQKTGGSVLESQKNLASANDLGFEVLFNPRVGDKLQFVVYKGVDHTIGNKDGNAEVYFSQSLNNLLKAQYVYNDDAFRNVELVAGEAVGGTDNENSKRTTLEVYLDDESQQASSYQRLEKFVDARDLQSEYSEEVVTDSDGNETVGHIDKKMTEEQYKEALRQRGNEEFGESTVEESYEGRIRADNKTIFQYKVDYDVGDKVTIIDSDFGIRMDVVISEMGVTYDNESYTYEPIFGVAIPTILDKIKRIKRRR